MSQQVKAPRKPLGQRVGRRLLTVHGIVSYFFLYVPIVILVVFSFNNSQFASAKWNGFTLRWYAELFGNEAIGAALRNSLLIGLTSTAIAVVFGTMVAMAMERYRFRGQLAFDSLLYLPVIIPDIAMAVMLLLFFVLARMPLGRYTVIIAHVAFNISFVAIVVRARLAQLDSSLEEAAQDLYANHLQTFRRVTLPLLMPGILAGALLAFTLSFDDFVITFFTAGPGATTLPLRIYSMVKLGVTPEINALSSVMLIISFGLVFLSFFIRRGGEGRIDLV
ncbi:MAG: ABC transporter permease [Anaerolineales bacterium]|nr:ABC transporter permease [Anaerolineales bacterium]